MYARPNKIIDLKHRPWQSDGWGRRGIGLFAFFFFFFFFPPAKLFGLYLRSFICLQTKEKGRRKCPGVQVLDETIQIWTSLRYERGIEVAGAQIAFIRLLISSSSCFLSCSLIFSVRHTPSHNHTLHHLLIPSALHVWPVCFGESWAVCVLECVCACVCVPASLLGQMLKSPFRVSSRRKVKPQRGAH